LYGSSKQPMLTASSHVGSKTVVLDVNGYPDVQAKPKECDVILKSSSYRIMKE
jgi:hypothetical protein